MGADDDKDCIEHIWQLDQIGTRGLGKGLDLASSCTRCGAVRYEPAPDPSTRPPL